jgi:zinc-binding alcohol dehydrogenase/oxidoreductase
MKTMLALVFQEQKNFDSLQLKEVPYPEPKAGEAVIEIKASALNHRDIWIIQGLYPGITVPIILGSDGSGIVHEVGAGVASLMLQMALAAGARVFVTSGSAAKIEQAVRAGAAGGVNYKNAHWAKEIAALAGRHGVDVVIDSTGGKGFEDLISLVNPGERIVFFGATAGDPQVLPMRQIFWKQISLLGTTMGSPRGFYQMVRLFERHKIKPMVDGPYPFSQYRQAYSRMMNAEQFGKIVLVLES